MKKSIAEN